eukprot:15477386-Alexandrium_andersonii.AAC.1
MRDLWIPEAAMLATRVAMAMRTVKLARKAMAMARAKGGDDDGNGNGGSADVTLEVATRNDEEFSSNSLVRQHASSSRLHAKCKVSVRSNTECLAGHCPIDTPSKARRLCPCRRASTPGNLYQRLNASFHQQKSSECQLPSTKQL